MAGGAPGDSPGSWLGFWHENRHFVECVRERRLPTSHFGDALKTMALVERINAAAHSRA
jgi:predicted dehydrogenase